MIKVMWVFRSLEHKMQVQAVLGKAVYQRLYQEAKSTKERTTEDYSRVINGEIMGKKLEPAKGTPDTDPAVCIHPTTYLAKRSNTRWDYKNNKQVGQNWFTCTKCLSRWERLPYKEVSQKADAWRATHQEKGQTIVNFGRYKDQNTTFEEIWMNDQQYANWVVSTADSETHPGEQLKELAAWFTQAQCLETEALDASATAMEAEGPEEDWIEENLL